MTRLAYAGGSAMRDRSNNDCSSLGRQYANKTSTRLKSGARSTANTYGTIQCHLQQLGSTQAWLRSQYSHYSKLSSHPYLLIIPPILPFSYFLSLSHSLSLSLSHTHTLSLSLSLSLSFSLTTLLYFVCLIWLATLQTYALFILAHRQ